MRYGTSTPAALVERAAEHGQPALALTDRDGLYGAVKFVQAATAAGIAPVLGVDLAVLAGEPGFRPGTGRAAYGTGSGPAAYGTGTGTGRAAYGTGSGPAAYGTGQGWGSGAPGWRDVPGALGAEGTSLPRVRTPVRGGAERDPRHPRVTVLARGGGAGLPAGVGWASLCRLVTDTHLSGERGQPVTTAAAIARRCAVGDEGGSGPLTVLLGPDSDVGRALLARRSDRARALLTAWQRVLPPGALAIEVVCHGGPEGTPASRGHAARMLGLADEAGLPAVLTAAVRHADPGESAVVDVLDAARRLVALDTRHLDRVTDAAHLASTPAMHAIAREVTSGDGTRADALHRPDPHAGDGVRPGRPPRPRHRRRPPARAHRRSASSRASTPSRCSSSAAATPSSPATPAPGSTSGTPSRAGSTTSSRSSPSSATRRTSSPSPTVVDLIRDMGVRVRRARLGRRLPGQLPARHLRGRPDPLRPADGAVPARRCGQSCPTSTSTSSRPGAPRSTSAILDRFGGERVTCVSMMDTYRVRHAIRDVGAALGPAAAARSTRSPRRSRTSGPATRAARMRRAARAAGQRVSASPGSTCCSTSSSGSTGCPGTSRCTRAACCCPTPTLLDRTPVEASWLGFPMSQFDKDDVEDLGPAQARRPRHPDAVGDGPRGRRGRAGSTASRIDLDDPAAGAARRRGDLPADPHHPHPRLLPDRVARASASWSASSARRRSRTSSSTSRCSGPGRSRPTWSPRSSRPGRAGRAVEYLHPDPRARAGGDQPASWSSTSRCSRSSPRPPVSRWPRPTRCAGRWARRRGRSRSRPGGGPLRPRRGYAPADRRAHLGGARRRSPPSGSARPTRRRSRCRPTSRPGSRPTTRRPSWPGCSPTTRACTPSG